MCEAHDLIIFLILFPFFDGGRSIFELPFGEPDRHAAVKIAPAFIVESTLEALPDAGMKKFKGRDFYGIEFMESRGLVREMGIDQDKIRAIECFDETGRTPCEAKR